MMVRSRLICLPLLFSLGGCSGSAAPAPTRITPPVVAQASVAAPPVPAPRSTAIQVPELRESNPYAEGVYYYHDTRNEPTNAKDVCEVANRNIQAALDEVLKQSAPLGKSLGRAPWSGKTPAFHQKLVEGRYGMTTEERTHLRRDGFVVLERLSRPSFAHAYHDIYQSQLPVYITMDSLFHAVFKAHETLMVHVEKDLLAPRLRKVLLALRTTLEKTNSHLPPELRRDLDLYLTVSLSLILGKTQPAIAADVDNDVKSLLEQIEKANGFNQIDLFGRSRMVDFSQYTPRGYYANHDDLVPYFKAAMWLSRLELNLVSRSSRSSAPGIAPDPRETPREAMLGVALARLVDEANMAPQILEIEETWQALGGKREDLGIATLFDLYKRSGAGKLDDAQTFEALKKQIGPQFVRTARLHYMPQGSTDLPVIFSLLGPRVTPDTAAQRPLVHGETPNRFNLHAADMAFLLGHDRARDHLQSDLQQFPELQQQLTKARKQMEDIQGQDLYSTWLLAIRSLSKPPPKNGPSFVFSKPFRDLRINSTVAAYGQLRRNNVLIAGQTYEEGGCEIPDGYVEPAPEVLDGLITFTERAMALLDKLGEKSPEQPAHTMGLPTLFPRMNRTFKALRKIVDREIAGEALTEPEKRLLATVAEIVPATSGSPPLYTGWYFHLFETRRTALENPSFIGDYYTSTNTGQVAYAGAGDPILGIFVVDVGGSPRFMVGPVARAYELHAPMTQRLTDDEGRLAPNKVAAWESSYLVKQPVAPTLRLFDDEEKSSEKVRVYKIKSKQNVRSIKVEYLSHHGQACGEGQTFLENKLGTIQIKMLPTSAEDPCRGGYRITVDGSPFVMDSSYFPFDMGLGDMWDLSLDEEN